MWTHPSERSGLCFSSSTQPMGSRRSGHVTLTERLRVHDERVVVAVRSGIADLDQEGIVLVLLAVAVVSLQQVFCVTDQTPDPTTWHGLEICAGTKRLRTQLLDTEEALWIYKGQIQTLMQIRSAQNALIQGMMFKTVTKYPKTSCTETAGV